MSAASVLFADTFSISTGTGIDFHNIAFVDEKRNLNFITVVDFRRFGNVGGGIAAHARFGFHDLFFNESRQSDINGFAVEEDEVAEAFFDQELQHLI